MTRTAETTSRIMASVPNSGTRPELALRRHLHRQGFRYRVRSRLIGRPDLVFVARKVAVFVDGDFWHGNSWRVRGFKTLDAQFESMTNGDFWRSKILKNIARDREVAEALTRDGWRVFRVWESDLKADFLGSVAGLKRLLDEGDHV